MYEENRTDKISKSVLFFMQKKGKNMKAKRISIFLLISIMLFTSFSVAKEKVIKTKIIYTKDKHYEYKADEEFKRSGKNYRIVDTKYEILKTPEELKKSTEIKNLKSKNAPKTKIFEMNGNKVKLFLDDKETTYTKAPTEEIYVYEARDPYSFGADQTRQFKTADGKEVKGTLKETRKGSIYKLPVNIPGKFTGEADAEHFYFAGTGNLWPLNTNAPIWKGYEQDILTYLDLNPRSYTITGGKWTSINNSNGYITRTASFTGTKNVCDYSCAYSIEGGSDTYTANATYSGYMIKVITTYESYMSLAKKIAIGVGFGVLAIAFATILAWIVKRKNKQEEEEI